MLLGARSISRVMRGTVFAVLALCLATVAACGSLTPGPSASSPTGSNPTGDAALNVRGSLDRGSTLPCPAGEPCDPPIIAMFLVFSQPDKPEVRVRVGSSGAFAAHLDPGNYSISAAPALNGRLEPGQVRVPTSGIVELHLVVRLGA